MMIKMGKISKLGSSEVISKAVAYFGPAGVGLTVISQDECCAQFEGSGGYVRVDVGNGMQSGSDVTVEGREFEYQIRQFMGEI